MNGQLHSARRVHFILWLEDDPDVPNLDNEIPEKVRDICGHFERVASTWSFVITPQKFTLGKFTSMPFQTSKESQIIQKHSSGFSDTRGKLLITLCRSWKLVESPNAAANFQ